METSGTDVYRGGFPQLHDARSGEHADQSGAGPELDAVHLAKYRRNKAAGLRGFRRDVANPTVKTAPITIAQPFVSGAIAITNDNAVSAYQPLATVQRVSVSVQPCAIGYRSNRDPMLGSVSHYNPGTDFLVWPRLVLVTPDGANFFHPRVVSSDEPPSFFNSHEWDTLEAIVSSVRGSNRLRRIG